MELQFPSSAKLAAIQRVGTGGGGEVWQAKHDSLGTVAVKIAHENNAEFRKLLTTEYTLLRSLCHQAIVSLFDFGCLDDGRPYIVMELCDGGDLYAKCEDLPLDERLNLFARALGGFEYLHNVGLIHRDIKGENILIARDGTPRISDLGLATASGSSDTERSGTLEYMAPEIIQNQGASISSDVYSLGVTLFRIITGTLPFSGDDPIKIVAAKQEVENVNWSRVEESISSRTVEFLKKCIHPDPTERTSSARAIIDHLLGERLVESSSLPAPDIRNYIHYHYRSFNYSFCRQELKSLKEDIFISDKLQNPESGLIDAVADYLKTEFCSVSANYESQTLEFERADKSSGKIRIQRALDDSQGNSAKLEYPELDFDSLIRLTTKILRRDLLSRYRSIIYDYSGGNLALLSLLLQALQEQDYLDTHRLRLGLPAEEIDRFVPGQEYWSKLLSLIPKLDHNLEPLAVFLACNKSDYPVSNLIEAKLVDRRELDLLVQAGILSGESYSFRTPYTRLYFYHKTHTRERHHYHAEWIVHFKSAANLDENQRLTCLFEHYTAANLTDEAINAAVELAAQLSSRQDFEEAFEVLSRVRRLAPLCNSNEINLKYQIQLAGTAKKLGKINDSLSIYSRVIRQAAREHDTSVLAEAYKRIGDLYKDKRQFARGLKALAHAREYYQKEGNQLELSHCFNNIGNLHWIAGDLKNSEQNYRRALDIQRKLQVERDIASTLSNLGTIMAVQQQLGEAIEKYEESIAIKRRLDDRLELARTLNNLARAKLEADRIEEARSHLREALNINLELGAENELPYNYDNLYELEYRSGDYEQAFEWLMTGLRRCDANDLTAKATFVCYLAEIMLARGRYGKAGTLLRVAARLNDQITDHHLHARLALNFTDFYRIQRDFNSARSWIQRSLEYADKIGDRKTRALAHLNSARACLAENANLDTVESSLTKAARMVTDLPARRELIMIQLTQLHWHLERDELLEAEEILENLRAHADHAIFEPFRPEYLYCRSWLEFARANLSDAAQVAQDTIQSAERLQAKEIKWQVLLIAGEAYRELGQFEKAMNAYIEGFETIKQIVEGIGDEKLRKMYLDDDTKLILTDRLQEMGELIG